MSLKASKTSLLIRYLFWFTAILITYYLANYFGNSAAAILLSLLILILSFRVTTMYYKNISKSGYFTKGIKAVSKQNLSSYGIIAIIFLIYYWLSKLIFQEVMISLIISAFLIYVTYQVIYYYSGREEENLLIRKRRRHDQFVNAIQHDVSKCISCFEELEEGANHCSICGFDNSKYIEKA